MSRCSSMGSELQFPEVSCLVVQSACASAPQRLSLEETKQEETEAALPMAARGDTSKTGGAAEATQGGEASASSAGNVMSFANTEGEQSAISASEGSSSESTSPSTTNPIRGTGAQRRAVRKLLRALYEKPWGERDMVWNISRRVLCHMGGISAQDKVRTLDGETRERLADSLFSQAYSAVMTVGTFSTKDHVASTVDALIEDPLKASELWKACKIRWHEQLGIGVHTIRALLGKTEQEGPQTAGKGEELPPEVDPRAALLGEAGKAVPSNSPPRGTEAATTRDEPEHIAVKEEVDWDSREDEIVETPPLIEEGEEAEGERAWKDLDDEVGGKIPQTPELLLSADEGGIEEGMHQQWPSQEALATIFRDTTREQLRKEWGMDTPSSEQPETPQREKEEQPTGERSSGTPPLEQDELVQQVMQDLRVHGGYTRQTEAEGGAPPAAAHSAQLAGSQLGARIRQRAEEERKRILQVGGMTVKLHSRRGELARGPLQAKVQRLARTLYASHAGEAPEPRGKGGAESLSGQMTRVAKALDEGGSSEPSHKARREKRRDPFADRPPLRRRRHLNAA